MANEKFSLPSAEEANAFVQGYLDEGTQRIETNSRKLAELQEASLRNHAALNENFPVRRNNTEAAQDAGLALVNSGVSVGEGVYGLADAASRLHRGVASTAAGVIDQDPLLGKLTGGKLQEKVDSIPSLDEATGAGKLFQNARNYYDNLKSDEAKAAARNVQRGSAERAKTLADREERANNALDRLVASAMEPLKGTAVGDFIEEDSLGIREIMSDASVLAGDVVSSIGDYAENPIEAIDTALESVGSTVAGGVVGSLVRKSALKGMTKKQADSYAQSELGKAELKALSEKAGIGYTAASESMSNAVSAQQEVLNMSFDKLADVSPEYRELIKTMSPEEARREIADSTFNTVAAIVAVGAGLISKGTGAGSLEGNLFNTNAGITNTLKAGLGGTLREIAEESPQGALGQGATNFAISQGADETRSLTSGVADAIGGGAVAGGLTGAVTGTLPTALESMKDTVEETVQKTNDLAKIGRVKRDVKNGTADNLTNTDSETYDPETAIIASVQPEVIQAKGKDAIPEIQKHVSNYFREYAAAQDQEAKLFAEGKEAAGLVFRKKNEQTAKRLGKYMDALKGLKEAQELKPADIDKITKEFETILDPNIADEKAEEVLGSSPTVAQAQTILDSGKLSDTGRKNVENYIKTETKVENLKSMKAVSQDVLFGGVGKDGVYRKGLQQFRDGARTAAKAGDTEALAANIADMERFIQQHTTKSEVLTQALKDAQAGNKNSESITLARQPASLGGYNLNIHGSSGRLVTAVSNEVEALNTGLQEMKALQETIAPTATEETTAPEPVETPVSEAPSETVQEAEPVVEQSQPAAQETAPEAVQEETGSATNTSEDVQSALSTLTNSTYSEGSEEAYIDDVRNLKDAVENTPIATNNTELVAERNEIVEGIESGGYVDDDMINRVQDFANKSSENSSSTGTTTTSVNAAPTNQIATAPEQVVEEPTSIDEPVTEAAPVEETPRQSYAEAKYGEVDTVEESAAAPTTNTTQQRNATRRAVNKEVKGVEKKISKLKRFKASEPKTARGANLKEEKVAELEAELVDSIGLINTEGMPESIVTRQAELVNRYGGGSVLTNSVVNELQTFLDTVRNTTAKESPVGRILNLIKNNKTLDENFKFNTKNKFLTNGNDLLELAKEDPTELADRFEPNEVEALVLLAEYRDNFKKNLESKLKRLTSDMRQEWSDQKPVYNLFLDDNNQLVIADEVINAMAATAFNYIGTGLSETILLNSKTINSILGNPSSFELPADAEYYLAKQGVPLNTTAESLGNEFMKMLGLKSKPTAPGNVEARMPLSIGLMIIDTMEAQNAVEYVSLSEKELDVFRAVPRDAENRRMHVRPITEQVPYSEESNFLVDRLVGRMQDITAVMRGNNVMDNAFGAERVSKRPLLEKPTKLKDTVSNGTQKVPAKDLARGLKDSQRPVTFKLDKLTAWIKMAPKARVEMAGGNYNLDQMMPTQAKKQKAKNEALERDMMNILDWMEEMGDYTQPFYLENVFWKSLRMGVDGVIDPQQSKMMRHLLGKEAFDTEVDPLDEALYRDYQLALAESFDIDVGNIGEDQAIAELKGKLENPTVQNAIDALVELVQDNLSPESIVDAEQDIVAGVQATKMNMHGYDALVALAKERIAGEGNPFETSLFREVDGKTNGVAIGLLQIVNGAYDSIKQQLARAGVYLGNNFKNYTDFKNTAGNFDSYEATALIWSDMLKGFKQLVAQAGSLSTKEEDKFRRNAKFFSFIGNVDNKMRATENLLKGFMSDEGKAGIQTTVSRLARKFSKNPLMITNYGAGIGKVIGEFSTEVLGKVYDDFNSALNDNDVAKQKEINNWLSTITDSKVQLSRTKEMHPKQEIKFREFVEAYYGPSLEAAIDIQFEAFKTNRQKLNNALLVAYSVFKGYYDNAAENKEKALGRKLNSIEKQEIVNHYKDYLPVLPSVSSEGIDDGILVMKTQKVDTEDDPSYRTVLKFDKPRKVNQVSLANETSTAKYPKTTRVTPNVREFTDGGVSGAILGIHNIDAGSMLNVIAEFAGLNVHDAVGFKLGQTGAGAIALNQSFLQTNQDYSLINAANSRLNQAMKQYNQATNKVKARIDSTFAEATKEDGLQVQDVASDMNNFVYQNNQYRSQVFNDMTGMDQYVMGGSRGTFNPTTEAINPTEVINEIKDTLGSADGFDTNNFNATLETEVNDKPTTERIYKMMENTGNVKDSPAHKERLNRVFHGLVANAVEPFKLKVRREGNVTLGATQGRNVYVSIGSQGLVNGTQMSTQETYLHELVHLVTRYGVDSMRLAATELENLFNQVAPFITAEDFLNRKNGQIIDKSGMVITEQSPNYAEELAAAKERYDYIFNNTSVSRNGRNNYLHEFVAFGLTNESFANKLAMLDAGSLKTPLKGDNIFETLTNIFSRILSELTNRILGTNKMSADKKLMKLAQELATVEKQQAEGIASLINLMPDAMEKQINKLAAWVAEPLTKLAGSSLVQKTWVIGDLASAGVNLGKSSFEAFRKGSKEMARRAGVAEDSLISELAVEYQGGTARASKWHRLGRLSNRFIDQMRQNRSRTTQEHLMSHFLTANELTSTVKKAFGRAILKTDLQALTEGRTLRQLVDILKPENPNLSQEITSAIRSLRQFGANQHYYRKMAKSLGHLMATGRALEHETKLNAHVIAQLTETGAEPVGDLAAAEKIINELASLYAISSTDTLSRSLAYQALNKELETNATNNGFGFLLSAHKANIEDSRRQLFGGNPAMMVKGYTKEILNPRVSYEIGYLEDAREMASEGYVMLPDPISKDPLDPDQTNKYMFVNRNGIKNSWLAGIASLTSRKAKGTDLVEIATQDAFTNEDYQRGVADSASMYADKQEKMEALFSDELTEVDPFSTNLTVPVIDEAGNTRGYRYLMNENTKHEIFEKNDEFDKVFGAMEASIVDKVNSKRINEEVVNTAYEEYLNEYSRNPDNYVRIGLDSSNPKYKEIYQQLPEDMRREIRDVWGSDGMYVPDTLVPLIFGQRKLGTQDVIENIFSGTNNQALNMFAEQLGKVLGKPGAKTFDNVWREFVTTVKDVIVIRSGFVMVFNILSNLLLLANRGVNPMTGFKDHYRAYVFAKRYQEASDTVEKANRDLAINPNNKEAAVAKARALNSMERNPVKDLVEEGVYQSIVEDVVLNDDDYSYQGIVEEWAKPATDLIPKPVRTLARYATISRDTKIYKFLRDTTQLSDFVARYSLHQKNLADNMSKDESIDDVVKTFVNYDLPTNRYLQYANDMGLVMFSKFAIRIQRTIADLIINHPGKTLSLYLLQNSLGDVTDVIDSLGQSPVGNHNLTPLGVAEGFSALPLIELTN